MIGKDKQTDIAESIDELESLIEETKIPPKLQGEIPVLNDVVDAAEARRYAQAETTSAGSPAEEAQGIPIERMNQLFDTVDQKLSKELDSMVDLLKNTIKDSIIEELKEELKKGDDQMESASSEIDPPDKPSK